jgi:hypothetical protein
VHDHLAIAHVVFLDRRPLSNAPQLRERGARIVLVLGPHHVIVVFRADQLHLDELRVGKKIQRHEIGARFLDGGVLLLQHCLRRASELRVHPP